MQQYSTAPPRVGRTVPQKGIIQRARKKVKKVKPKPKAY